MIRKETTRMTDKNKIPNTWNAKAPAGEAFVWLTSLGLSIGLFMIVFILGLIIYQGLLAFWPRDVIEVTVKEKSEAMINNSRIYGGEIVKKQVKKTYARSSNDGDRNKEWQLFVGNKDVYGFSFFFLDVDDIKSHHFPENVISIERDEYGDAIVYPVSILENGEPPLPAERSSFDQKFSALLDEVNERRLEIRKIEKTDIGRINKKMESIRLKIKSIKRQDATGNHEDLSIVNALEEDQAVLQTRYEQLAITAFKLREQQEEHKLVYRLMSGEEMELPFGKLIGYYYPNKLTVVGKFQLMIKKIWHFVREDPREANTEGGIFPAILGTFAMTLFMSLMVTPVGIMAAVYLTEYAKQGFVVRMTRIAVNNLAGIPSIVFGVFGLGFFVYTVGGTIDQLFFADSLPTPTFGTGGVFWASLTLRRSSSQT